jgi:integrase
LGYPFEPMFKLMLITGQRRDEVAGMRHAELKDGVWTLPVARTKNKREHVVPLPQLALDILAEVKSPSKEFVFSTTGKTAASGFSRAKHKLDGLMKEDLPKLEDWRLHDLRRTAASGMARVGVNLPVIEKTLNHVSGSFGGIVGVYQRHSFHDEKKQALEVWSKFLLTLVTPAPDNVVPLPVKGAKRRALVGPWRPEALQPVATIGRQVRKLYERPCTLPPRRAATRRAALRVT